MTSLCKCCTTSINCHCICPLYLLLTAYCCVSPCAVPDGQGQLVKMKLRNSIKYYYWHTNDSQAYSTHMCLFLPQWSYQPIFMIVTERQVKKFLRKCTGVQKVWKDTSKLRVDKILKIPATTQFRRPAFYCATWQWKFKIKISVNVLLLYMSVKLGLSH